MFQRIIIVLLFLASVTSVHAASFADVLPEHEYAEAIAYVQDKGLVEGYADGTFAPDQLINRAEFAKILVEAFFPDEQGGANCFSDVIDEWYAQYVCSAKDHGLVGGYLDGSYRPGQEIVFVEGAKMIVSALDSRVRRTDPWYRSYVTYLERQNALPTSLYRFDQLLTRGELAEMLYRVLSDDEGGTSLRYIDLVRRQNISTAKALPADMSRGGSYFENDPIAKTILAGDAKYDMGDLSVICGSGGEAPRASEKYGWKILMAMRSLGYLFDNSCRGAGQNSTMEILHQFQRLNGLPQSRFVGRDEMEILDREIRKMEVRDRDAYKRYVCSEFLAEPTPNGPSKEHLAYLHTLAFDAFPSRFALTKQDCKRQGLFEYSKVKGLICDPSYWPRYWRGHPDHPDCSVEPWTNWFGFDDYWTVMTKVLQYADFLIEENKVDIRDFISISFDVSDVVADKNGWKFYRSKLFIPRAVSGFNGDFPPGDFSEVEQHFFGHGVQTWAYSEIYAFYSPEHVPYYQADSDFSDTLLMYVLHGRVFRDYMKDRPPLQAKYAWLKDHFFEGREFESGDANYREYASNLFYELNAGFAGMDFRWEGGDW
jgi:hypothetical protein